MKRPLQIIDLLKFAANRHPRQEIVTRRLEGDIHRYSYAECWQRSGQLAHALQKLGVQLASVLPVWPGTPTVTWSFIMP